EMRQAHSTLVLCIAFTATGTGLFAQQTPSKPEQNPQKTEMDMSMTAMSSHHHDEMGQHMRMSKLLPSNSGDEKRAAEIVRIVRQVLEKYRDYNTAVAAGFEIFMPNLPQPMYHFTNYRYALEAEVRFNPDHPTSLLYEKKGDGYTLVGAMFTAPAQLSEAELDRRIPLSVAQWHQHVNFCLPPEGRRAELLAP